MVKVHIQKNESLALSLKCGLCRVTSFQRVEFGKGVGKSNFSAEKLEKYYLSQEINVNINNHKSY